MTDRWATPRNAVIERYTLAIRELEDKAAATARTSGGEAAATRLWLRADMVRKALEFEILNPPVRQARR